MPKVAKYGLITFTITFCLFLLLFTPITKTASSQNETKIQTLINKLKDPDPARRRAAAWALNNIGPDARDAAPALVNALKDEDEVVRRAAAWALHNIGPDARDALPALIEALKDEDKEVRRAAAWALTNIGPDARDALPALIEALKDEDKEVRRAAAEALTNIGPDARDALPVLIEALKDEDEVVRRAAAEALGEIGLDAKVAVPALVNTLKDEEDLVRRAAAGSLGKIAAALRDAKATDMIKDLEAAKKALSAHPDFKKQENTLHQAIQHLEHEPPLWKIVWNLAKENILESSLILVYILWVIMWLIIFWLHPLALLRINQAFKPFDFQLPKQFGSIKLPIRFLLFIGFLNYRPRVLNGWIKKFVPACRKHFSEKPTVQDRKIHISVPVELNKEAIPDLTVKNLRSTFARQIGCLLIWGEGGSGKTSLACQIAKWAMAEDKDVRLCDHLMLPVLIEQELTSEEDQSAFISYVGRQLQDLTDQANPITEELLERLLRQRRILVIVDHLSEMSKNCRDQIQPEKKEFPANALIVTSRLEETLGGVKKTVIKPLRVAGNRLSSFMEAYLTQKGKRHLFDDPDFFDACRRLSEMVGDRDITLLLAKLYAEQLIASKEGITEDKLPDNIPDLMFSYLNDLNRSITEDKIDDRFVHQSAKILAWMCLKDTYRPSAVCLEDALSALNPTGREAHLEYLEHRLRLVRTVPPAKDRLEFALDPLAEYLCGLHFVELYSEKEEDWNNFLTEADSKEGAPEAIKGFLLAVRDCIIAKGQEAKVPDFVADEIAKRAGLDPETTKTSPKGKIHQTANKSA